MGVGTATLGQLRVKEDDLLYPEDLLAGDYLGQWVRTRMSSDGHRVSPEPSMAYCGFTLIVDEWWYETEWKPWVKALTGQEPRDYFIALDNRKGSKCTGCSEANAFPDSKYVDDTRTVDAPVRFDTRNEQTTSERTLSARFRSKVAWLVRELGATVEHGEQVGENRKRR